MMYTCCKWLVELDKVSTALLKVALLPTSIYAQTYSKQIGVFKKNVIVKNKNVPFHGFLFVEFPEGKR